MWLRRHKMPSGRLRASRQPGKKPRELKPKQATIANRLNDTVKGCARRCQRPLTARYAPPWANVLFIAILW
jgi:hypothetical protein